MSSQKELLDKNDVVSLASINDKLKMPHTTFKVNECCKSIISSITNDTAKWCEQGVEAEVLSVTKGWRKGKLKIAIEFIPDQPESPLDDIRKNMGINE